MAQLQRPPFVYMNGQIAAWDDATIHISAEAVIRGISVFEGIKGYWSHDGRQFALLAIQDHYLRLVRSALLQQLPFSMTLENFTEACFSLVRKLLQNGHDMWLRPTLLSVRGNWGADTETDLAITAYQQEMKRPEPIEVGVSTWRRPVDTALPARIKSAANYQIGRFARIEGRRQGFSDMLLLNAWGRVAEATGSCVLMVRDGSISTPPPYEGCLESITVNIVEALCRELGLPFERRPIDRTELMTADEIALAGTLMELGVVRRLESRTLPIETPILARVRSEFWACLRGLRTSPAVVLTPV